MSVGPHMLVWKRPLLLEWAMPRFITPTDVQFNPLLFFFSLPTRTEILALSPNSAQGYQAWEFAGK